MKTVSVLAGILVAAACGNAPTAPSDLIGATWRLVSIERDSGPSTVVTSPERYTLEFLDEGRVAVRADCNRCSGSFTLSGETLSIGTLACTRAFCGSESLDTEFLRGLDGPLTAAREQSRLSLRGAEGMLRLRIE